jgi:hypothetical protein
MLKNGNGIMAIEKVVKKMEESKDKDGYSFEEHLTEIINRLMLKPKENTLNKIEELSYLIKMSRLRLNQPLQDTEVSSMKPKLSERKEWVNKMESKVTQVNKYKIIGKNS